MKTESVTVTVCLFETGRWINYGPLLLCSRDTPGLSSENVWKGGEVVRNREIGDDLYYCRVRGEWKLVHAWNTLDRGRDRWVAWRSKGEIWGKWLADILSNACTPPSSPRFLGAVAFVAIDADSAGKLIENRCNRGQFD